jgi:hypothetical protein
MRPIVLVLAAAAAIAALKRPLRLGHAEDVGLGDVIKRATNAFGIPACRGCARRAAVLNRRFAFSKQSRRQWLPLIAGRGQSSSRNPLLRLVFGRSLGYDCTTDGSACVCRGMLDCLDLGKTKKCKGKIFGCWGNACFCFPA